MSGHGVPVLTAIRGADELRVKESDRIAAMATGLRGREPVSTNPYGAVIEGGATRGGTVESHGDHRVVMAFVLAGTVTKGAITIRDCTNVATSFPNSFGSVDAAGLLSRDEKRTIRCHRS